MNDKLLLRHTIKLPEKHLCFLQFMHPNYSLVSDLSAFDKPNPAGIIYTGKSISNLNSILDRLTPNWIIINNQNYDLDLSTNEGLLKNILPVCYIKFNRGLKPKEIPVYEQINYDDLLEQIKLCLISNESIKVETADEVSVYNLYSALLCTPKVLAEQYFSIVNKNNVALITSSVLTFLTKVQSKNIAGASPTYARLIIQSNARYGKRIKSGIQQFIKSKSNKEVSLYSLLSYLNKG